MPPNREADDELAFHLEGRARELIEQGWTEVDAYAEAQRRFGDMARIRAELARIAYNRERRTRRLHMLDAIRGDVRVALRALRRNPGFAAIAVMTVALGIGATTAIFSIVDGVLLRPLRVADPDRLVVIFETNPAQSIEEKGPSGPNFMDWRAAARSFAGMAAFRYESFTLTDVPSPQVLSGVGVTANLIDVLGVQPMLGRAFRPGEDQSEGAVVTVLSHGTWQRLFGGAPDVIGRTLTLNGSPFEVVGVMPPEFAIVEGADLFRPVDMTRVPPSVGLEPNMLEARQARYLSVVARLGPGVTLVQAEQEMNAIAGTLARTYPIDNEGWTTRLVPARDVIVRDVKPVLLVVLAAVGFVLLIACANVANLVLGRATARESEIALRAVLGAGRARLHMQMLTESVVLALAGGILGVGLAFAGVPALVAIAPDALPRIDEVSVDTRVLAFSLVISLLTGLLFGLAPSLRVGRIAAAGVLREAGRGGTGARRGGAIRRTLIVGEVALALLLLVGAGLTLRSVQRLLAVNPGYVTQDVIAARVSLDGERYLGNPAKVRYVQEITARLAALPGVQHAAVTSTLPLTPSGIDFDLGYHAEGEPEIGFQNAPKVDYRIISPGYLAAMGIPLLAGRDFTDFDRVTDSPDASGHRVMLVNESFARQHWPGESPIGKHVRLYYVQADPWEVVGVVGDTRHAGLATPPRAQVFVPMAQVELVFGFMTIVVRTEPAASGVVQQMRDAAIALDPSEPLYQVESIETLLADATARDRMAALVFSIFALLAIALSAAGIYGVIAYQVTRRTREIGVRIALGAGRSRVVRDVVGEAAGLALVGIVVGVVGALILSRFASSMLYGVAPWDPLTFGSVSILLLGVALGAALVPAARAAGIQPVEALRAE
jgi:putative ABC transport system permease protein